MEHPSIILKIMGRLFNVLRDSRNPARNKSLIQLKGSEWATVPPWCGILASAMLSA